MLEKTPAAGWQGKYRRAEYGCSRILYVRLQRSKYAAAKSENMANSPNQVAHDHLSTSASVAGTLHLAAFASADSCEGFVISHETASLSLQVAALGTSFTAFNSCMMRPRNALSALTMEHADGHWRGTVRHMRWRVRAMSSARTAAYGQQCSLHTM